MRTLTVRTDRLELRPLPTLAAAACPRIGRPRVLSRRQSGQVSTCGFRGPPDDAGSIEFGYSVVPSRRRRLYPPWHGSASSQRVKRTARSDGATAATHAGKRLSIKRMADGVLLLTGPPGSGKTTTAALIATAAPRGVHLEVDSFFHFVRGGYIAPWLPESHAQNVIVMQAVAAAAAHYADGGYATVVDGIISPAWFLRPLADALGSRGQVVSYAILRPTLETCIAQATARSGDSQRWRSGALRL